MLLRSRTRFRETNHVVTSLVRFTAEAQILPLIAGLCFLGQLAEPTRPMPGDAEYLCLSSTPGLYAYDPNANFSLIPSFTETKLTALSVVHVLNSFAAPPARLRRTQWLMHGHPLTVAVVYEGKLAPPSSRRVERPRRWARRLEAASRSMWRRMSALPRLLLPCQALIQGHLRIPSLGASL